MKQAAVKNYLEYVNKETGMKFTIDELKEMIINERLVDRGFLELDNVETIQKYLGG